MGRCSPPARSSAILETHCYNAITCIFLGGDYVVNCNLFCPDPGRQSGRSWVPSHALGAVADARQHRSAMGLASSEPWGSDEK